MVKKLTNLSNFSQKKNQFIAYNYNMSLVWHMVCTLLCYFEKSIMNIGNKLFFLPTRDPIFPFWLLDPILMLVHLASRPKTHNRSDFEVNAASWLPNKELARNNCLLYCFQLELCPKTIFSSFLLIKLRTSGFSCQ